MVSVSQTELAFYGDDFTGSTDVLESLSLRGKSTILWLRTPTQEELVDCQQYACIGIAGVSRSKSPQWMREELPPIFQCLRAVNPKYVHYKVCSTFDSSLEKGNIAVATSIGQRALLPNWTSIVVGTPKIKRYVCFGELFADYLGDTFRIDRHPVMSCHPATPMSEANIALHMHNLGEVACQSINMADYLSGSATEKLRQAIDSEKVVVFDSYDEDTLDQVGSLIRQHSQQGIHFSVSSSGFEDALYPQAETSEAVSISAVEQILALSGSCSPITQTQITYAIEQGFEPIKVNMRKMAVEQDRQEMLASIVEQCITIIQSGGSPLVYSALGPQDDDLSFVKDLQIDNFDQKLGQMLGEIAYQVRARTNIQRIAIAGGDTSGYCMQSLKVDALTFIAPFCPGVPLCQTLSGDSQTHGVEVALKGGQMGEQDFFVKLVKGTHHG
ncbi:four-carbon acid sugar kinase family protein [Vibrio fluvialis]|nr:four-carbon acid sugar kinase family protein [Vibrio fluvialis]MBY7800733.1 hypothetical protein [Vibrio fluvialis]